MKTFPLPAALALLTLTGGLAKAQGEAPSGPPDTSPSLPNVSVWELLKDGGYTMIPLAGMALLAIILITLYTLTIRRSAVVTNRYMKTADSMLRKRDFMGLLAYSQRRSELVARLTAKTLKFISDNPQSTTEEIKDVAEAEGSRQSGILAHRISWLADIGAIAPMLGLLGTVLGMIQSFLHIAQGGSPGNLPQQLANGVSEALVTTASGLVIGITAIFFHSYFKGRVNKYLYEFESASTHIITLINNQLHRTPTPDNSGLPQMPPASDPAGQMYAAQDVVLPQGQ